MVQGGEEGNLKVRERVGIGTGGDEWSLQKKPLYAASVGGKVKR